MIAACLFGLCAPCALAFTGTIASCEESRWIVSLQGSPDVLRGLAQFFGFLTRTMMQMPKCSYCGVETQLHTDNGPICLVCAVEREPRRKPGIKERLPSRGTAVRDSNACPECARLEADRLKAIKRYVDLRAARQCVLRECPTVVSALDAALTSVEVIVNETWKKLAEHQASHELPASA